MSGASRGDALAGELSLSRLWRLEGLAALHVFIRSNIVPGATAKTDGLASYSTRQA